MRYLKLRRAMLGLVAACAMVLGLAAPAHAWPVTYFSKCANVAPIGADLCNYAYTNGSVTWYNRTALVTGQVVDIGAGYTVAYFYAWAGNVLVDPQSRTADDTNPNVGSPRNFSFTIGDTNRVGGISRIEIWVCTTLAPSGTLYCGTTYSYEKP